MGEEEKGSEPAVERRRKERGAALLSPLNPALDGKLTFAPSHSLFLFVRLADTPRVPAAPAREGRRALAHVCATGPIMPPLQLHVLEPYTPPTWTSTWTARPPPCRYLLGALPTPVHAWRIPQATAAGVDLWIKRDDMTGSTLSGNKVRKLEFLFAEAMAQKATSIITVGGIQSNHARATAAAAAEAGLSCHLILRASESVAAAADPGLVGNLLVDRLTGAHVHLVSKAEYARVGGPGLTALLADRLEKESGVRPYIIPVGGSNAVGAWGYVQCVTELEAGVPGEATHTPWDNVVVACGSGGTVAGLAAGIAAAGLPTRLHAAGVCDDPAYFEAFVRDQHLIPMGVPDAASVASSVHYLQAKGSGYALSRPEELATGAGVALATGILCDGTYVGKALHAFLGEVERDPASWKGRRVLFLHTGGLLSMADQAAGFEPGVRSLGRVERMVV